MSDFSQYLAILLLYEAEKLENEVYSGSFISLAGRLSQLLGGVDVDSGDISRAIDILNRFSGATEYKDPLTGGYYKVDYDNFRYYFIQSEPDYNDEDKEFYQSLRAELVRDYPILVTYAENGEEFAKVVVEHLQRADSVKLEELRATNGLPAVPASNRLVTLNHNQTTEFDEATSAVIKEFEKENSFDGSEDLRSDLLGRLKAGRELVRAQTFRAYLLYSTLMSALSMLIDKYKGHAIGIAATKLFEMLIEQVFKD